MVTKKPKGLGRGLEALLGPKVDESPEAANALIAASSPGLPASLLLDDLVPGQYQPRTRMDEGALYELAESIKVQGIMQPILVRRLKSGANSGKYEIIAGERRFRAARLAGLDSVPVLMRDVPDESAAAMALIENIQREDLNPLEEAQGLQRLVKEFGLTHELAAQAVGRSRSAASQPAAPAEPGRPGADHADGRRPRHGPCARAAGAGPGDADHRRQPDHGQKDVGARGRKPGQEARRRVLADAATRPSLKSRATPAAWKKNWPTC